MIMIREPGCALAVENQENRIIFTVLGADASLKGLTYGPLLERAGVSS